RFAATAIACSRTTNLKREHPAEARHLSRSNRCPHDQAAQGNVPSRPPSALPDRSPPRSHFPSVHASARKSQNASQSEPAIEKRGNRTTVSLRVPHPSLRLAVRSWWTN